MFWRKLSCRLSRGPSANSVRVCAVLVIAVFVSLAAAIAAQTSAARTSSGGDSALKQAIIAAEDARATETADLQPLLDGVRSNSPAIQALAVRALGRLERPSVIPNILPLLAATSATVRAEAANALAQAVQGPGKPDSNAAAAPLHERLKSETDPMVRGVLYEAVGRLPYQSPDEIRDIELVLVNGTREAKDSAHIVLLGTARGFEALYRVHAKKGPAAPAVLERLREIVRSKPDTTTKPAQDNAARARRLLVTALQFVGADVDTLRAALRDPDALVRKQAASFLEGHGRPIYTDDKAKALQPVLLEAIQLHDSSPLVRYEAVQGFGRYLNDQTCTPLIDATKDPNGAVALAAIDNLGRGCPAAEKDNVIDTLRRLAGTLPPDDKPSATSRRVEWHRAAHALVSLAALAPDQAKTQLSTFASHPVWQVRAYAARVAATLKDASTLRQLADDRADNVRSAAITGLSRLTGHADDTIFIAALSRSDHQLTVVAARALQGTPKKAEALPVLMAALNRYTSEKKDNTRDARVALLQRLREIGSREQTSVLEPYLKDFDPRVATLAAETVSAWTGTTVSAAPTRPKTIAPNFAEVMKLESAQMRIHMKTGGTFDLRLFPSEAPATVDRFVRLARSGYYDGLTFHRVAPNWVMQGGSPAAQEVTGDSPFMIDEVGLRSHTRGAVGISTRGRDTGDAQMAIDLCDNVSLDHNFTVWAEIIRGMDVVDGVLEGDVIERIESLTSAKTPTSAAIREY